MIQRKKIQFWPHIISMVLFSVFAMLAYLFPYTGDDWAWGSHLGIDRLKVFFANYNGRYIGNLLVLLLTRSKFLDVLVMAASFTFTCWICYRYSPDKTDMSYLLAIMLFFFMPRVIWAEAIVWTSGFTNYVPSALISVSYIMWIGNSIEKGSIQNKKHLFVGMFLMGYCGALFMENITLLNLFLAIAGILYTWLKFKKIDSNQCFFLIGAVLGVVTMFSNAAYSAIAKGEGYYREVARTSFQLTIGVIQHAKKLCDYLFLENYIVCLIIAVLLILVAGSDIKRTEERSHKTAVICATAVNGICALVIATTGISPDWVDKFFYKLNILHIIQEVMLIAVSLVFAVSIIVIVALCVSKERQFRMLLPLYCMPISLAPLLVVNPIGPRCAFIGYLLMMVFTVDLFSYVHKYTGLHLRKRAQIGAGICVIMLLQILFYFNLFVPIHVYDVKRIEYAKFQSVRGDKLIYICHLPRDEYLHYSSPVIDELPERFALFYGLDTDVEYKVISLEELNQRIKIDMK